MSRNLILAWVVVATCFLLLPWQAGAATASGSVVPSLPTAGGHPGAQRFSNCVSSARKGDVLLLIDESGSMRDSDQPNARVTAAQYLLQQLVGSTADANVQLDVAVAGFGNDFDLVTPWTALTNESLDALDQSVAGFTNRTNAFETDYWTAMDGARDFLAQKATADGVQVGDCQAIIWFTDGELQIQPRLTDDDKKRGNGTSKPYAPGLEITDSTNAKVATAAAGASLCSPGGVMDQVRSAGVVTFAIGLEYGKTTPKTFDLLQAAAEGKSATTTCGNVTDPAPGDFQTASNLDGLLLAFDNFDPNPPIPGEVKGVCSASACTQGRHTFVLDSSIKSVRLLGSADAEAVTVQLQGPTGARMEILPGPVGAPASLEVGNVKITYAWESGRTVQVKMQQPAGGPGWAGQWAVTFIAQVPPKTATSRTNIHLVADIKPTVTNLDSLKLAVGTQGSSVVLGLVDSVGKPFDVTSLQGDLAVDAQLIDAGGKAIPLAKGLTKQNLGDPVKMNLNGVAQGKAVFRLTMNLTTAAAKDPDGQAVPGTKLSPQTVDQTVEIAPAPDYPTIASPLAFGTIEKAGSHIANVQVTGPGCVWLPTNASSLDGKPESLGDIAVGAAANSPSTCVSAAKSSTVALPVDLTTTRDGKGSVNGRLVMMASPSGQPERAVPVRIQFSANVVKSLDSGRAIGAGILAFLIALLVPVGLLYGAKWWSAVIPVGSMRTLRVPVRISDRQVLRGDSPFALHESDKLSTESVTSKRARRATLGQSSMRTKIGLAPTGAPYVRVDGEGLIGVSGEHPASVGQQPTPRLSLGVANSWFFQRSPEGRPDTGIVTLIFAGHANEGARNKLTQDMVERLPALVSGLDTSAAAPAGSGSTSGPTDSSGGPPPYQGDRGGPGGGPPPYQGDRVGPATGPPPYQGDRGGPGGGPPPPYPGPAGPPPPWPPPVGEPPHSPGGPPLPPPPSRGW